MKSKIINIGKIRGYIKFSAFLAIFIIAAFGVYLSISSKVVRAANPIPPTSLTEVAHSSDKAAFSWTLPENTDKVAFYKIYRDGVKIGSTDKYTNNFYDKNLSSSTAYSYTVATRGISGVTGAQSDPLVITTDNAADNQVISGCSDITQGGNYILTSNLVDNASAPLESCLDFSGVDGFSLDCNGHSITQKKVSTRIVAIHDSSNFLISDCNFIYVSNNKTNSGAFGLEVWDDSYGYITGNNFTTSNVKPNKNGSYASYLVGASVVRSNNIYFYNSNFRSSMLSLAGHYNYVGYSDFTWTRYLSGGENICSCGGSHHTIVRNNIDGESYKYGESMDDGIIIQDEGYDIIDSNTITRQYDAAIEGAGTVHHSKITNNKIDKVYYTAIGSYHHTSWSYNDVSENTMSNVQFMFTFTNDMDTPKKSSFKYNKFNNNKITKIKYSQVRLQRVAQFDFSYYRKNVGQLTMGGNSFKNNSIGLDNKFIPVDGPVVHVEGGIIKDGGGNICARKGISCFKK